MRKTTGALAVFLVLGTGACSDDESASVSTVTTPSSADATVPADTAVPRPGTTSATDPATTTIAPQSAGSTSTSTVLAQVTPTSPTLPGAGDSTPEQPPTSSSPAPASNDAMLVDTDCTATRAGTDFDLLHVAVEALGSGYRFTARYSGDTFQHDIVISFDLGSSAYRVTAELFEDGNGVARVLRSGASEDVFLDRPQAVITSGVVDLNVRNDQLDGISGTPFTVEVSLRADGSDVETCR